MSDDGDVDFEDDSRELDASDVDLPEDSGGGSDSGRSERPARLKLTLKPRMSAPNPVVGRGRGSGRPRGRPRGSGSGLTLKVRRKQPDVVMDEPTPPPASTPAIETGEISSSFVNHQLTAC